MTAGDCRASNWIRHKSVDCIIEKDGRVISRCGKETTWYIYIGWSKTSSGWNKTNSGWYETVAG